MCHNFLIVIYSLTQRKKLFVQMNEAIRPIKMHGLLSSVQQTRTANTCHRQRPRSARLFRLPLRPVSAKERSETEKAGSATYLYGASFCREFCATALSIIFLRCIHARMHALHACITVFLSFNMVCVSYCFIFFSFLVFPFIGSIYTFYSWS